MINLTLAAGPDGNSHFIFNGPRKIGTVRQEYRKMVFTDSHGHKHEWPGFSLCTYEGKKKLFKLIQEAKP